MYEHHDILPDKKIGTASVSESLFGNKTTYKETFIDGGKGNTVRETDWFGNRKYSTTRDEKSTNESYSAAIQNHRNEMARNFEASSDSDMDCDDDDDYDDDDDDDEDEDQRTNPQTSPISGEEDGNISESEDTKTDDDKQALHASSDALASYLVDLDLPLVERRERAKKISNQFTLCYMAENDAEY